MMPKTKTMLGKLQHFLLRSDKTPKKFLLYIASFPAFFEKL